MSTTSPNLGLVLAEAADVVNVSSHIAGNFSTLDSKWSAPGSPADVLVGTGATPGSSTVVARSDHVHVVSTGTPSSTSTSNSAGSASTVARSDHVHANGTNSVPTAAIQDSAVTTAKIADSNVTMAKIADSNVTTAKIADSNVTTAKIADSNVTTAKIADSNVTRAKLEAIAKLPVGAISQWLGSTEPTSSGWKYCNGQAISRTTFSELFSQLGTSYGAGDGSTTFNLPNFIDRVAIGSDSTYTLGGVGGSATQNISHTHTLGAHIHNTTSHTHTGPSHTHGASALGVFGNTGGPSALDGLGNGGGTSTPSTSHTHNQGTLDVTGTTDADGTGATGSAAPDTSTPSPDATGSGGSSSVSVVQPYLAVRFIIYTGVAS